MQSVYGQCHGQANATEDATGIPPEFTRSVGTQLGRTRHSVALALCRPYGASAYVGIYASSLKAQALGYLKGRGARGLAREGRGPHPHPQPVAPTSNFELFEFS